MLAAGVRRRRAISRRDRLARRSGPRTTAAAADAGGFLRARAALAGRGGRLRAARVAAGAAQRRASKSRYASALLNAGGRENLTKARDLAHCADLVTRPGDAARAFSICCRRRSAAG